MELEVVIKYVKLFFFPPGFKFITEASIKYLREVELHFDYITPNI